ncbi:MAG: DEAD/DEAH box helicase [Pyrinomonadaceae bacterium]|nr:DEAD/DEAH box helicase [Pyrinomonadaceae bacterium]MBP6213140.1 DEAD/DEAH box helicase [Pyrinomonadaceae bacterium]
MTFKDLGLLTVFTDKCEQLGYTEPTPVQQQAIPVLLQGGDILASAETGTGKTAAFLLPILQMLGDNKGKPGTRVLILSPTRELANQTEAACRDFAPKGISCTAIIGGAGYKRQMDALRRGANIIIATPGRLIDFMDQGLINFNNLTHLVLDEADRMLDMGFLPSIKRIVKVIPANRQTLFFSATMSAEIEHIAYAMLKDPTYIEVSPRGKASGLIEQTAYPVAQQSKMPLLLDLLDREDFERVLVFTRTKRGADRVAHVLEKRDHKSNRIHGDRSQSQREAALRSFKSGHTNVLVATDVAARGIDIDSISHVINYDIPEAPEDYVHRIGRTGRAGNKGTAITLFTLAEEHSMRAIERLTGERVERVVLPDFGGHHMPTSAPSKKAGSSARKSFRSFGGRRGR